MSRLCDPEKFGRIFANPLPAPPPRKARGSYDKRSRSIGTPRLVRDQMDPIVSQGDGQTYDSKSAYYQHLKRDGLEIVDAKPEQPVIEDKPVVTTEDVKNAFEQSVAELNR